MVSEWRQVKIGQVAHRITKGTTPTTAGGRFVESGIAFVKVESITEDGRIDITKLAYIDEATNKLLSRSVLQEGDILFTIAGTIGRVAMVPRDILPANTNQAVAIIRPNPAVIEPRYLYYALRDEVRVRQAHARVVQSVQANFSLTELSNLEIPLPQKDEQRAIAHILGTLDDKIELCRRMNETLEAMARAIFKAWFVDFEPVRAKMDGRWRRGESLAGLPAHLYDLFPDRLVGSELGEIPEGWEVGTVGDVLSELVSGSRPKGGATDVGVPSIGAENIIGLGRYDYSKEKYVPREFFEQLKARGADVRPGDVLLYKDGAHIGRKTYFDCNFPHAECAVNEHVLILRCRHRWLQRYLYFWLDLPWMTEEIVALNSSSAQPGINQTGVRQLTLLSPPDRVVQQFDLTVQPLLDTIFRNCQESRTLAALRDALLPKLIRGEIRVKDAERFLEGRGQ